MCRFAGVVALTVAISGCANADSLRTDLSARPVPDEQTQQALLTALTEPLEHTSDGSGYRFKADADNAAITRYLNAGMTLSDIYCDDFFRRTNSAFRKRKFGRGATNDVGTAVAAVLGLASANPKVVAGAATGFGLADSTWRNYDESFVVSPQLATMRSLVLVAQDKYRTDTFKAMPKDFITARSAIVRYAAICSFLGMQGLLDQSVEDQRRQLQNAGAPAPSASPSPVAGNIGDRVPTGDESPAPAPPAPAPAPAARVPVIPTL